MKQVHPIRTVLPFANLLGLVRWLIPERSMDAIGPHAILDEFFALGLLVLVILLSVSLGEKVLQWLNVKDLSLLDRLIFEPAIGLGILAYGILSLGLVGWLRPWTIFTWLLLIGLLVWKEMDQLLALLPVWGRQAWQKITETWKGIRVIEKAIWVSIAILLIVGLAHALTPPWDYDGLMYHLQGAKLFLQAGRIQIIPDMLQVNSPFTVEMLFIVGLVFGSDIFAKLLHFFYAILFLAFTFSLGKRYLGSKGGMFAVYILLSMPILPFLASWAHVDFAWGLYEILGLYALILWNEKNDNSWLILAGIWGGIALGIKYQSIASVGLLGLIVVFYSIRRGIKCTLAAGATFGGIALLIGSPWYLKNLILAGNPVYPMYFGGIEWPVTRIEILAAHLESYGSGTGFWDILLLPWNLLTQPDKFSASSLSFIEILPILAFISLLYPAFGHQKRINILAFWALCRFILWAFSYQVMRHLLPLLPILTIMAAAVLISLLNSFEYKKITQLTYYSLFFMGIGLTMILLLLVTVEYKTIPTLIGNTSKNEFIKGIVQNSTTIEYIQSSLPNESRVLMMWDGRGYYCDSQCLPSADQSRWTWLATTYPDVQLLSLKLKELGATHLMFSLPDARHFVTHDISGKQKQSFDFFVNTFIHQCARQVNIDKSPKNDGYVLYEITCP